MQGSLARRSPADVLSDAQRNRTSGVLTFRLDPISRQIHLEAGVHIRFAASNHPAESLTSWFLERGGVAEEQLRQAALEKRPEEFLGSTLLRLGLVTPEDLVELTEMHIRRIARAAMRMGGAAYQFQEGGTPLRDPMIGGVLTAEVLLEWTREINNPDWIRGRLGSPDSRIQRGARPPDGYQRIRLDPAEGYIMSRVDGVATIREICMVSPMGDDKTLAALLGLSLAGILEMPGGATEQPGPAARPELPPVDAAGSSQSSRSPSPPKPPAVKPSVPTQAAAKPIVLPSPTASAKPPAPSVPAASKAPPPAAARPGSPQAAPAFQPPGAARPGPIGLVPKARIPLGGAGRGLRPVRRPGAAIPKPLRPAIKPAAETVVDVETEMLRRFRDIHTLDLYQVLDVAPVATMDMIRRSYYALARRLHPDTFHREDLKSKAEKVFGRITEAYATLSHPTTREKYDEERQARGSQTEDKSADATAVARMNFKHGREHFEHGRLSEALSFLQNACQQDPTRAEYFEYLGMAQTKNPRLRKQAEESLLKAIELAPMSASSHALLGQLYERAGVMDRARAMYRKALEWDPTNETALAGLESEGSTRKGILGLFSRK
ncbi:MAG TPA: DnaJ domain-containing protein [Candidatus Cryosericum sp.]|nr:DnaJ domain-containing protein [Candidatus Cryosericum sp.]